MTPRRDELAANLADTQARIAAACGAAGRDPAEITLVVVTKTFPASDLVELAALGVRDVGENRHQEAAPKFAQALAGGAHLVRHMIGQLQTNKAAAVAAYADVLHAVDRLSLVRALATGLDRHGRTASALVQVSLDNTPGRGGADPDDVCAIADAIAACPELMLRGVMAVAPLGADPDAAFARLARVAERLRVDHPDATWVSAGMSGDLEAAVRQGATHLRVGTAILGSRSPLL